mmetsp:Transcript_39587/g.60542  ORF Transcript_39587/g.60542 Transcript_39587/m.60542 type:complete len:116 (+) Transcript_39587:124-471(+)
MQVADFAISNFSSDAELSLLISSGKSYSAIGGPSCSNCGDGGIQSGNYIQQNDTKYSINGAEGYIATTEISMEYSMGSTETDLNFVLGSKFHKGLPKNVDGYLSLGRNSGLYVTG